MRWGSKVTTVLALLAGTCASALQVLDALKAPEVVAVLPPALAGHVQLVAGIVGGVAVVVAALSRALVDADGDGTPDVFEAKASVDPTP